MTERIKIAIVGRPNVGKSALFNALCGQRLAIVEDEEGVTRDRLYCDVKWRNYYLELIDTGGIDPSLEPILPLQEQVRRQAEIAIEEADALVLVVDAQAGATALDQQVARMVQKTGKPVALAVNKIDSEHQEQLLPSFLGMGFGSVIGVSALHRFGLHELFSSLLSTFEPQEEDPSDRGVRVTLVGRPNVGKSTLINAIVGEERCVVSDVAGTTRDSVDVPISFEGRPYVLVDTAGVRRKKSEKEVVEKFASMRTELAIERSDICLLLLDAREGMTVQDKKILQSIEDQGKGCLVLLNKWDLVPGFRMEHVLKALRIESPFLAHCPILCISAIAQRNLDKIFHQVDTIAESGKQRMTTGQLNRFLEQSVALQSPPMILGRRLRIYYMTQVATSPPRFVIFVNRPQLMTDTYKKFLMNRFRKLSPFTGHPLIFYLRGKEREEIVASPCC